jgi:putative phage-type endonuclease
MTEIIDIPQGSDEWFKARVGSIGGSAIATVVSKGSGRTTLLYRMAAEILAGKKLDEYTNDDMKRGIELEPDARREYEFIKGVEVRQVGMVKAGEHRHMSPDGLVGDDGMIEIKSPRGNNHIETIITERIPAVYRRQCQWGLSICERDWLDFVSYCPVIKDKPIFIIRTGRDEKMISELSAGAEKFIEDLMKIVERVRG